MQKQQRHVSANLVRLAEVCHPEYAGFIFQHTRPVSPECFLPFYIDPVAIK